VDGRGGLGGRSAPDQMRVAILTVSDRSARGERPDGTGPTIEEFLTDVQIVERKLVPDERDLIEKALCEWADADDADLIIINGGTGLGPRDVTPEATRAVIEREVPGIGEMMRTNSPTPLAYLSRQVAGTRGRTLIVNVPGSPKAARECLEAIAPILAHAVEMTRS